MLKQTHAKVALRQDVLDYFKTKCHIVYVYIFF